MFIVFLSVIFTETVFGFFFYIEYLVKKDYTQFDTPYLNWIIIFFISISIEILSSSYIFLSELLTNNENQKTETNYEDALILKTLIFKLFNHYSAVIFTAFFKGPLLGTCDINCMIDVQQLLIGIFIVRFLKLLLQLISPYIRVFSLKRNDNSGMPGSSSSDKNKSGNGFDSREEENNILQSGKKYY